MYMLLCPITCTELSYWAPEGQSTLARPPIHNQTVGARSPRPYGLVVAYFKYQSTKYINQHRDTPGTRIWQRNYYDHVLRDDINLERIRQYITDNPMQWELDQLHPNNLSK